MSRLPILLLGEAPNEATAGRPRAWLLPDRSRARHAANNLLRHSGWSLTDYLRVFQRRDNLVHECPPRAEKGYTWHAQEGRRNVPRIIRKHGLLGEDRVSRMVILGRRVASCFEWEGFHTGAPMAKSKVPLLEWHVVRAPHLDRAGDFIEAAILPHPSGVNTWWNLPENREAARAFLAELREDVLSDQAP